MRRALLPRLALALTVVGCGSAPGREFARPATEPGTDSTRTFSPADISRIRWDRPMGDEGLTATIETARDVGQLPFEVHAPRFGVRPALLQVSDPARNGPSDRRVAMAFRFPVGPDFPTDGRLLVTIRPTPYGVEQLRVMDRENEPADAYQMTTIGTEEALLIQGGGIGRILYIRDGLLHSITGPAVSPEVVRRYAEKAFLRG